ncbi:MAG: MMPL family transporter [Pseudomonadales bacterium]|nr:MMPL family transporter [Pseudomonadales bacterium]
MNHTIAAFITRRPLIVFIAMLGLTAILAYQAVTKLSFNVVLEEMMPADAKNIELVQRFVAQFGGANTTLIEIKTTEDSIYSQPFLEKYKRIADEVYYHPDSIRHLNQSLALRKTKAVSGGGGRVEINAIMWPDLPETAEELAAFRREVNNQYRGFLVSDDERSAMIIADFNDTADFEELLQFFDTLRGAEENATTSINVVGRPILLGYIYKSLQKMYLILLVSILIVAVVLYAYFKTWFGVFVPIFTASVATVWGLGAMAFTGYNLDPLLILLPAFIFAIVLSHGVQFTSRLLENLERNEGGLRNCAVVTFGVILIPSSAAIITDAAGFGVLGLAKIPSIQSLAVICSIWLLSIAPALLFSTSLLCLLPKPSSHSRGSPLVEKIWGGVIELDDHKYLVVGITTVALIWGALYSTNLEIGDTKGSAILWPDSRYNYDVESINTRFSRLGTDVLQVYIEGDENTMLDPSVYHTIEALDRYIYEHVSEARQAQSLVSVIKLINSVLYEGDPSYEMIPDTTEAIGFNIYLFRSRGEPGDFAAYTNNTWEIGNVSIYVEDHSSQTIGALTSALDEFFEEQGENQSEAAFLYSGGQIGIVQALNDEIRQSNMKAMMAIVIVISLCILLYYRSFFTSLILLFSLATANFVTYAFMTWKGVGLNVSTLPLAALGVGLGVDYGIYMVDRIKEEYSKCGEVVESIHNAMRSAGNAIFVTAVTMTAPLLPWVFVSPLRFQSEMGMLLGLVLLMNMLGSLLFVPAALAIVRPRAIFRPRACDTSTSEIEGGKHHRNQESALTRVFLGDDPTPRGLNQ